MKPWRASWLWNLVFLCAVQAVYVAVNHVVLPAREIPPMFNEQALASHLIGAVVYLTHGTLLFTALQKSDDRLRLRDTLLAAGLVGLSIHLLFPTFIPPGGGSWRDGVLTGLLDQSRNAFPSLHVATCVICALLVDSHTPWRAWSSQRVFFIIWAVLISVSTVTTRQHRLLDVFGGLMLAVVACAMTRRKPPRRESVLRPLLLRLLVAAAVAAALCARAVEVGPGYTATILVLASIIWGVIAATVGIIALHEATHIRRKPEAQFARIVAQILAALLWVGVKGFHDTHSQHHEAPATKADPYAFCAPRGRAAFAFSLHPRVIAWCFRPGTSSVVRATEFLFLPVLISVAVACAFAGTVIPFIVYLSSVVGGFAVIGDHTFQTHPYGRDSDGKDTYDVDFPHADFWGCGFWSTHTDHHRHTPRGRPC